MRFFNGYVIGVIFLFLIFWNTYDLISPTQLFLCVFLRWVEEFHFDKTRALSAFCSRHVHRWTFVVLQHFCPECVVIFLFFTHQYLKNKNKLKKKKTVINYFQKSFHHQTKQQYFSFFFLILWTILATGVFFLSLSTCPPKYLWPWLHLLGAESTSCWFYSTAPFSAEWNEIVAK